MKKDMSSVTIIWSQENVRISEQTFLTYLNDHTQFIQDYWLHKKFVPELIKEEI